MDNIKEFIYNRVPTLYQFLMDTILEIQGKYYHEKHGLVVVSGSKHYFVKFQLEDSDFLRAGCKIRKTTPIKWITIPIGYW